MKISNNLNITSIYREQLKKAEAKTGKDGAEFSNLLQTPSTKPAESTQAPSFSGGVNKVNTPFNKNEPIKEADAAAATMQFAAKAVANSPDVRAERVNAIKKLFDAGQYNIPAEAVAEKLFNSGVVTRSWEG